MILFYLVPALLCWGSFLNFVAYRLVNETSFRELRSICPSCKSKIAWYDLIPIISWILLKRKCRNCNNPISYLYPLIEILTLATGLGIFYRIDPTYQVAYFIFTSALLIVIRTDLETMLISRFTTLFLIPLALLFSKSFYSYQPLLPISTTNSIKGAVFGYLLLFLINKIFYIITKKQGMGQGDLDLLALIGSFTGIIGVWISLMIGSILGSITGIILINSKKEKLDTKIPFGPFLSTGAIIFILFKCHLLRILFS